MFLVVLLLCSFNFPQHLVAEEDIGGVHLKISQDRGHVFFKLTALRLFCVKQCRRDSETETLFETRPMQATEVTRPHSSIGKEDSVHPYMERRNPFRDNKDQAQSFCTDLRVQGELDQSTDDEERKRSLVKSKTMEVLQFPGTRKFMASLFPKNNDNEYQDISQDAEKIKPISKLMKFS